MFDRYAQFYDLFNQDKPYKKEIEFVHKWAGKPLSILDIGCGVADYWKFYPQWVRMVGLEKSRHMIAQSRYKYLIVNGEAGHKFKEQFDCVTALFDVLNYIPTHEWWKTLPLKKGGHFIFDIWDSKKVKKDGFKTTEKKIGDISRIICPIYWSNSQVYMMVMISDRSKLSVFSETHTMYLHSQEDIERFCGKEFEIVQIKHTKKWQTWLKLKKR